MADDILSWYKDRPIKEQLGDPAIQRSPYDYMPTLDPMRSKSELKAWNPDPLYPAYKGAAEGIAGAAHMPTDVARSGIEGILNTYNGRYGPALGNAAELAAMGIGPKMPVKGVPRIEAPRINGRYSVAEEAALNAQRKQGNAQAWTNELLKAGTKPAELDAVGWSDFTKANPNPTRDDVIKHLQENRPQLQTTHYGSMLDSDKAAMEAEWAPLVAEREQLVKERGSNLSQPAHGPEGLAWAKRADRITELTQQINAIKDRYKPAGDIKWTRHAGQDLLLDPDNPLNRETVISTGPTKRAQEIEARIKDIHAQQYDFGRDAHGALRKEPLSPADEALNVRLGDERSQLMQELKTINNGRYIEPHFRNVPDYLAHLRTGIYKDESGLPNYHFDEIQSTRERQIAKQGGPRDEAKIAELQKRYDETNGKLDSLYSNAEQHLNGIAAERGVPDIVKQVLGDSTSTRPYQIKQMLGAMSGGQTERGAPADVGRRINSNAAHVDSTQNLLDNIKAYEQNRDLHRAELEAAKQGPSGHPFVNDPKTAYLNAIREGIRQAVDSGVSGITLTPGSLQNERYSLTQHVKGLGYAPINDQSRPDAQGYLLAIRKGDSLDGRQRNGWDNLSLIRRNALADNVGREMAERILARPTSEDPTNGTRQAHLLADLANVELGGKGMKKYYDETYPAIIRQELERLHRLGGTKGDPSWPGQGQIKLVGSQEGKLPSEGGSGMPYDTPFHHFPLTDQIKKAVKEKGLPFFTAAGAAGPLAGTILDDTYGRDQ